MLKTLLIAAFLAGCGLSLRADNLLQNGDFSAGVAHWQGDGQSFGGNHLAPGAFGSQGLVVMLNPHAWTRIFQVFKGDKGTIYSINVTYQVSQDLSLSTRAEDYTDVNTKFNLAGYASFGHFNFAPGLFLGTIGDPNSDRVAWEVYSPRLGTSDKLTYQHTYPAIAAMGNNTAALAFPPGTGSVTVLSVAVTSQ